MTGFRKQTGFSDLWCLELSESQPESIIAPNGRHSNWPEIGSASVGKKLPGAEDYLTLPSGSYYSPFSHLLSTGFCLHFFFLVNLAQSEHLSSNQSLSKFPSINVDKNSDFPEKVGEMVARRLLRKRVAEWGRTLSPSGS